MSEYIIMVNQNGGEYRGWVKVTCGTLTQLDERRVKADDAVIEFDENISGIQEEE